MALSRQVVDLVGLNLLDDPNEVGGIREIPIVQFEAQVPFVRILIKMVDSIGVERRGAAFDAVHRVSLCNEEFGKVGTILPGDARD